MCSFQLHMCSCARAQKLCNSAIMTCTNGVHQCTTDVHQMWSPQGRSREHVLKSLASKPQVVQNCPVLGSKTALLFDSLKFCRSPERFFEDLFFSENTCVCVFGLEHSCLWSREGLSSEGLSLASASNFFCVLRLKPCVLDSTSDVH